MPYMRKYGVAIATGTKQVIQIPIIKAGSVNYAVGADWTPVAGDVKIIKNGDHAAAANIGTLPVARTVGNTALWEFVFSQSEMEAGSIRVVISDAATKAVEDQSFEIETYGHASAMEQFDPTDAVRGGLTALPNANAAASGGLIINGTNAGAVSLASLTCVGQWLVQDGIGVTCTTTGRSAMELTGNGTGHGLFAKSGNGTTGEGIYAQALSTNGQGIFAYGRGTGHGFYALGGATGSGAKLQGGSTGGNSLLLTTSAGNAIEITPTNGDGIRVLANGSSKHGIRVQGGTSGTSDGINVTAGTGGVQFRSDITGALSGAVGSVTGNVGGNVAGSVASVTAGVTLAASQPLYAPAKAGDEMALTSAALLAVGVSVETACINEADGNRLLDAMTDAIAAANPDLSGLTESSIAAAVRVNLAAELACLDAAVSTRLAAGSYTAPLSAAGTRSALGMAAANLDTQLSGIPFGVWDYSGAVSDGTMGATVNQIADESLTTYGVAQKLDSMLELSGSDYVFNAESLANAPTGGGEWLDEEEFETGETAREFFRRLRAMIYGPSSGAGTREESFLAPDGSTVRVRVVASLRGNREEVTFE